MPSPSSVTNMWISLPLMLFATAPLRFSEELRERLRERIDAAHFYQGGPDQQEKQGDFNDRTPSRNSPRRRRQRAIPQLLHWETMQIRHRGSSCRTFKQCQRSLGL